MSNEIEVVSEKKLTEYLNLFGAKDLTDKEKMQFLEIAKAYNLNPFKREIYMTAYGEGQYRQCSIITGYEVYIKRAEKSDKLDGYSVITEGNIPDMTATITIYRKDWSRPFIHTVEYSEYVQKKKDGSINKFWAEKPKTMLKKVATAQGFRLCFSNEFGGMPYTSEEMPQPDIIIEPKKIVEIIDEEALELLSEEQLKHICTLITVKGITEEQEKSMKKSFNVESKKELTKKQADEIISKLNKMPDKVKEKNV